MTKNEIFQTVQQNLKTKAGVELNRLDRRDIYDKGEYSLGMDEEFAVSIDYPGRSKHGENQFLRAEVKEFLNTSTISSLFNRTKAASQKVILITQQVTTKQAEILRELNIPFGDTAGNAYLSEPGLYVFVTGQKTQILREKPSRVFDKAGLKIIFACLTEPGLIRQDLRTIAKAAGVRSISTVSDIFRDLEKQHYLYQPKKSVIAKRKLVNRTELVRRWVDGYIERLRPSLHPIRFISRKFEGRWWDQVQIKDYKAVWGGEKGGQLLTNHLHPATVSIYAVTRLPQLQAKYGLVRSEQGNIEILEKFWTNGDFAETAPPLVVYADLIATGDERNLETARIIYERYLIELTRESA